jgi:hypothetical protein
MSSITVTVSDDRMAKLKENAGRFSISPEELAYHQGLADAEAAYAAQG